MSADTIIIGSGLVAFLVAYSAVRDSAEGCGGRVGPLRWNFSDSWASTSAVLVALVFSITNLPGILLIDGGLDVIFYAPAMLGLGLLMLIAPLIYKGLSGGEGASKRIFLIFSTVMTWSTFAILCMAALAVSSLVGPLPVLPTLAVYTVLVLVLAGALMNSFRSLANAASGDPSEVWTLP